MSIRTLIINDYLTWDLIVQKRNTLWAKIPKKLCNLGKHHAPQTCHHMKISKSNKSSDCTESGLIFSISGSKMLSILVKQVNFKPMSNPSPI